MAYKSNRHGGSNHILNHLKAMQTGGGAPQVVQYEQSKYDKMSMISERELKRTGKTPDKESEYSRQRFIR